MGLRGRISDGAIKREAGLQKSEPVAPKMLSKEERDEWNRVTSLLKQRGLLDRLDQVALHDYLKCWTRLRECEAEVSRDGLTVRTERGVVKNPACTLATQYRASLLAWSKELGLTIGSRLRMNWEAHRIDNGMEDPFGDLD